MFSRTTIESSTTRPMAMVRAPSVSMLSERSRVHSTISVSSTDSGMEIAVTSVERSEARKRRITTTAKRRPSRPSVVRPSMDLETAGPWSLTTVSFASAPRSARSCGSLSLTASEIATALPSWSMVMAMPRLGLPSVRVMEVGAADSCLTVAMSPTRTGLPPLPSAPGAAAGLIRRSSICFSEVKPPPTWTVRLLPPSENAPAGTDAPFASSACPSAAAVSPAWASFASSGVTATTRSRTPSTLTWPTPSMFLSVGTTPRSSLSASACWSSVEETASTTVGMSSVEPAMTCGSTSLGSCEEDRFTACWTLATSLSEPLP